MQGLQTMPLVLAALSISCATTEDTAAPTDPGADIADFVDVTDAPIGDTSCFTGQWITQTPDPTCQNTVPLDAEVEDFESGDEVPFASVEMFYENDFDAAASQSLSADDWGAIAAETRTCQPLAFLVTTDDETTHPSYEYHRVHGPEETVGMDFLSVASSTVTLLTKLLGVEPIEGHGVIVGTAFDCNDDELGNAQVVVRDATGWIPPDIVTHYFSNGFPAREQRATSDDGLWLVGNVPEGDWIVETWVSDGAGGQAMIGSSELRTYGEGVFVASTYVGFDGGIKYPEECLSPCE